MVKIMSNDGYPKEGMLFTRVDYYIRPSPNEGGILVVGRDSQGREYRPKTEPPARCSYVLPSGAQYAIAVGSDPEKDHPAIYFPFLLDSRRWQPKVINDTLEEQDFGDEFFSKFDLTLMDEAMQRVSLPDAEVERTFKEIAVWGAYELKGERNNHFWGEMYRKRTPALERFLEAYRG